MAKRVSFADLGDDIGENSSIDGMKSPAAKLKASGGVEGLYLSNVPLDKLVGNPRNPRDGDLVDLEDLKSIADKQLQPGSAVTRASWLKLFPDDAAQLGDAEYVVVTGNRRLAASRAYGRQGLDIVVTDSLAKSESSVLIAAVLENIARKDLDVIEEAKAVELLVQSLSSAVAAAEALRRTPGWVSQRRTLLKLKPELQESLRAGEMSIREARKLARVPGEEQVAAWFTEQKRKESPPEDDSESKSSAAEDEKNDSDRPEATPVDKIVKVYKAVKPDLETVVAALEEYYDSADLFQIKGLLGH